MTAEEGLFRDGSQLGTVCLDAMSRSWVSTRDGSTDTEGKRRKPEGRF